MIMTRRPGFTSRILVVFSVLSIALPLVLPGTAEAVRIKDIATFSGVRSNQLVGYGLVVGLGNTGDTKDNFTKDSLINMMERMGVAVDSRNLKAGNVASVMVTASLPVSAKAGSNVDVTVSSIGSATSLQGGVLLQTPLKGVDGKIYALAQGAIIVGGYSATGAAARTQKNSTTVASIPGGAIVEREVPFSFNSQEELTLNMQIADFSTTQQVVEPAEQEHGRPVCQRAGYQHSADQGSFRLSGQSCAAAGHGGESGGHARITRQGGGG